MNAKTIINNKCKSIKQVIVNGSKVVLAKKIKEKLVQKIEDNFYDRYKVGENPHWLIQSLKVEVVPKTNNIEVFVFFDNQMLAHNTWWGSNKLGIQSGESVYTPQWINDGWTFDPYTGERMNKVGGVNFLEDAIKELEVDNSLINEFYKYLKSKGIELK